MLQNIDSARLVEKLVDFIPHVIGAIIVLIVFWVFYSLTRKPLERVLQNAEFDDALVRILTKSIYRTVIILVAIIMAAGQLGINVVAAITGLGIAGIAIGFAAKDSLSNIISGFIIFWDKPFHVGDWITVAGEYGKVHNITLRTTRIRTRDNTYVIVPNQKIIDEVLTNHSKEGKTRVQADVGIAYKESIPKARKVLEDCARGIEGILDDEPRVTVVALADSSVNLSVSVWVESAEDELSVQYELLEACKLALDDAGIEIPFPHLQLFVEDIKNSLEKNHG